jgi:hypothetical protein
MDPKLSDLLASIGELLANLTDLSPEQLSALTDQLSQAIDALSSSDATDAVVASAGTLADAAERVAAERTRREGLVASAADQVGRARGALRRPTPVAISRVVASAAGHRDPERERPTEGGTGALVASLTAGADRNNSQVHGVDQLAELFDAQVRAARSMKPASDGERVVVASSRWEYPADRDLRGARNDPQMASDIIEAAVQPIVASGGICRPVNVDYAIPVWGTADRPIRDSLPSFQATRGGLHFIAPVAFDMGTYGAGVSIWTAPNDATPGGANTGVNSTRTVTDAVTAVGTTLTSATAAFTYADVGRSVAGGSIPTGTTILSVQSATQATLSAAATAAANGVTVAVSGLGTGPTTKPALEMNCGSEMEVLVEAIPQILNVSNMRARFSPEVVAQALHYLNVAHAVTAEVELLRQMRAFAKHVSGVQKFGIARDVLTTLDLVAAYTRDRYRLPDSTMLRVVLKRWVRSAIRADLAKAAFPFEDDTAASLAVTDAQIDAWFAARNVVATWALDDDTGTQNFGAQGAGTASVPVALNGWPATTRMLVYPEGTYQFLDGGQLDLGVTRDSTLNAVNKFQIFSESFEGVAPRGFEAVDFSCAFVSNGASAGTVAPS